ncbi:cytochrome P450 [Candidatus Pandoraea novymonadis]|uniref:Biotin biosynthesis cytochrome P450 n=1 Tax=Candidatus Pandoraea novymonadis TaxID=1808959 RepID=A0ABX5FEK5_9BURK|nr:cytochrome P450 [Candidatus Pandoraea novymonadis]PSB92115.1 Biotin biosynthesis cytochrome P450 [Candidatus Pandoraea novymonadis]
MNLITGTKVHSHPLNESWEEAPVWSEVYCKGAWVLSSYRDVAAALRDPRFSVARAARWVNSSIDPTKIADQHQRQDKNALREFKRLLSRSLLFIDGHAHIRLRRAIAGEFNSTALQKRAPRISGIVDQLIKNIISKATLDSTGRQTIHFDYISEFAQPIPALVIADLMGVTPEIQSQFIKSASSIATFIGSPIPTIEQAFAAQEALVKIRDYFNQMLNQPNLLDSESITAKLLKKKQKGQISTVEMLAQSCTLLFAGYETTRHLLGNGMLALLRHPAQWKSLQNSPELLPRALRELLRYDSPIQYTGRRLRQDVSIQGCLLRKGQLAILDIASANRDPRCFISPNRLDINRDERNHLSFGYGPHACVGATLTYMEANIAFQSLMKALPRLQLTSDKPLWQSNKAYHGLTSLPLTCVLTPQISLAS